MADVASSGLGVYAGLPERKSVIVCSALPTGPMSRRDNLPAPKYIPVSGFVARYETRFDDLTYYSA